MISIAPFLAEPLEGALESPGGFAWWYVDLVDDAGNGIVLIPAWGLPFLPGRMGAARSSQSTSARTEASLVVSVYRAGRPVFYALQQGCADNMQSAPDCVRFDRTEFRFSPTSVDVDVDLDAPGGIVMGSVRIEGIPRAAVESPMRHARHEWSPLFGPATGAWDLRGSRGRMRGRGSAYVDRNAATTDLERLGFHRWFWARAQLPDRLRVGYAVWTSDGGLEAMLVDVHGDGRAEASPASVTHAPPRKNTWGLPWLPEVELRAGGRRMHCAVTHRPDESFFYQRTLSTVETEVGGVLGVAELCDVSRIDRPWSRPLVDMCVQRLDGPSSPWLPLFSGPADGRFRRLLRV